ncbi:hypothetical protein LOD99_11236 [Oopsacas minuta]|uniref:Uncharacterized protein n=1 Tax=Oopsacas minuta TaxID=111878 RepID=A0AAV7K8D9_9METZ|nr:hypothetical protein LOD99_11236 [Oopsacas minuta]
MCQITANMIITDIEFCISHPIENELWYTGVYLVIEFLRDRSRHNHECSREFLSFLTSTMEYYNVLISSIQSDYRFSLSNVDNINSIQSEFEQRKILRAVQWCPFLYLSLVISFRYQVVLRGTIPDSVIS